MQSNNNSQTTGTVGVSVARVVVHVVSLRALTLCNTRPILHRGWNSARGPDAVATGVVDQASGTRRARAGVASNDLQQRRASSTAIGWVNDHSATLGQHAGSTGHGTLGGVVPGSHNAVDA